MEGSASVMARVVYGGDGGGAGALEVLSSSCECREAEECFRCPLNSKFYFSTSFSQQKQSELSFVCEGCVTVFAEERQRNHSKPSQMNEQKFAALEAQMIEAKKESATLKARLQQHRSAHEKEIRVTRKDVVSLRGEVSALNLAYEDAQRRLRFLRKLDLDLSVTMSSKTDHATESLPACGFLCGGRRFLATAGRQNKYGTDWSLEKRRRNEFQSCPVMKAIIGYCYTGDIFFAEDVPPEKVLKVAHIYNFSHLKGLCDQELCKKLNADNLWEMFNLSRAYKAPALRAQVVRYLENTVDVVWNW